MWAYENGSLGKYSGCRAVCSPNDQLESLFWANKWCLKYKICVELWKPATNYHLETVFMYFQNDLMFKIFTNVNPSETDLTDAKIVKR